MNCRVCMPALLLVLLLPITACKKKDEPLYYDSSRKGSAEAPVKEVPRDILATQQAFTSLVAKVNPAVVNISTISRKKVIQPLYEFSPFFDDFFGGRPQYREESSLGSGFIINKDGYIVTNDHVVRDAESIKVKLSNDKVYDARVVGGDPKTDIAVIRISSSEELPVAVLGDSDKLQVGQWAIAIGNPFGLDRTVTVGVVSATGRSNMGIETYEDFIQTDASINPGNSGGPLLNVHGEVIGINTAIVAAGQGIGFAIPVNMAKQVVAQLITRGNVTRGWLGVTIQPVTAEIARSFGLKEPRGVQVRDILEKSPAAVGGIRQGDIILGFDGREPKSVQQLQRIIADTPIGKKVEVLIFRAGREQKLTVTLTSAESAGARQQRSQSTGAGWLGLAVEELPREARGITGVLVADVDPAGAAAEAGIRPGDIITMVNQQRIASRADYQRAMKDAEKRGTVALLVRRGDTSIYFALKMK